MKLGTTIACASSLLLIAAPLTPAVEAAARGGARSMGLEYKAPPDCPQGATFAALVAGRTGGTWRLREIAGEPRFSVEIVAGAGGKTGRLWRTGSSATRTAAREVAAADCGDVVSALALTAALSLAEEDRAGAAAPTETLRVSVSPPAAPPPGPPARLAAGLALPVLAMLPPYPMAGVGLFLDRDTGVLPGGPRFRRPDLRLTVAHMRNDLPGESGLAGFNLTTGALALCPLGWWTLRACAEIEGGWLDGRGREIASPLSDRSLWLAVGALLRGQVALGGAAFLEASVGLWAPLRRTTFVFEMPAVPVAKVPAAVVGGGLAVGLSIP